MAPSSSPPPTFSVPDPVLVSKYHTPSIPEYLQTQPGIDKLITGAVVFRHPRQDRDHDGQERRVLLLQRAATDYVPNRWEIPGGTAEPGRDRSVLDAVARELWEESGLRLAVVSGLVHVCEWEDGGRRWQKVTFEVEVEVEAEGKEGFPVVRLDPAEHRDFVWASEEEAREGWCAGRRLEITFPNQEVALDAAFRRWKGVLN